MPFMLKIRWDIKDGSEADFRANQERLCAVMLEHPGVVAYHVEYPSAGVSEWTEIYATDAAFKAHLDNEAGKAPLGAVVAACDTITCRCFGIRTTSPRACWPASGPRITTPPRRLSCSTHVPTRTRWSRCPRSRRQDPPMIFIVVKFKVKPDWSDRWLDLVRDFTEATRAEPGNLWFDWSRSVEDPNEFVLVEAFRDDVAAVHVNSEHFQQAIQQMPAVLAETPHIISTTIEGADDWSRMAEITVD